MSRSRLRAMPQQLVTSRVTDELIDRADKATRRVLVASPFMGPDPAVSFAEAVQFGRNDVPDKRFLTNFRPAAIESGFLCGEGLVAFIDAGFQCRSITNLHA